MTITLLAPDGVAVTAQQERQARAAMYGGTPSRPLGGRSGFRPGTPADTLTATSTTWTLKPVAAMIDAGYATHQGMYGWASDANITGAVTAADATNPRKDIVYILVNDSTAGDGSGAVSAAPIYLAGAPGVTPSAPAVPARGFLVGTISVPKVGGGSPTVALNPARFAAAGAPLQVWSLTERDALDKFDGLTVQRMDLAGRPLETWNGSGWRSPIEAAAVVVDAEWVATGQVTRTLSPDGQSMVAIGERMARVGGGIALATSYIPILSGFVPVGYRPAAIFYGVAVLVNSSDSPRATIWWRITTSGDLQARLDAGSTTLNTGDKISLSGNWTTA